MATAPAWKAEDYAANGRFVATLASDVVRLLDPQAGERILDAGCGDGALTAQLAATGAVVRGVDFSESMIAAARALGLDVDRAGLTALTYQAEFDAVFSNAALHWIPVGSQPAMLAGIHRALKPGGRFVAEMGGQGNIAAIRTALTAVLGVRGFGSARHASLYPSPSHYRTLLEHAGFSVMSIELSPRPTLLPGGPEGMRLWLKTFCNNVLGPLAMEDREAVTQETIRLLRPALFDSTGDPNGSWTADYVRLRFKAIAR